MDAEAIANLISAIPDILRTAQNIIDFVSRMGVIGVLSIAIWLLLRGDLVPRSVWEAQIKLLAVELAPQLARSVKEVLDGRA